MQLNTDYYAVHSHNMTAPTIDEYNIQIGKHIIKVEVFVDYYHTYNTRVGVNGNPPHQSGEMEMKTNGIGWQRLIDAREDATLVAWRDRPIHSCAQLNDYGYPIDDNPFH